MRRCKSVTFGLAIMLISSACYAGDDRVWAKQFIGNASTNWDLSHGRTEITDIYLQVVGPSDLTEVAVDVVEACARTSLSVAFVAYYYEDSDVAGKLAAALAVFHAVFLVA
jgi:hypothetical protein